MKFVTGIPKNLRTKPAAAPCPVTVTKTSSPARTRRRHVALGSRPAPNTVQPARPHQAASSRATLAGGAARAAVSWASSPRHRRRSRADICAQACGRPSLSVEIHVHRAAARRLPSRRAASQRRGSGDNTPGRRCMGGCAGGAVLKKIAARFSFRGLRARKDTIAHATESHGVIRATVAVARRTGTQPVCVACVPCACMSV